LAEPAALQPVPVATPVPVRPAARLTALQVAEPVVAEFVLNSIAEQKLSRQAPSTVSIPDGND
jgi:hypothetical protein